MSSFFSKYDMSFTHFFFFFLFFLKKTNYSDLSLMDHWQSKSSVNTISLIHVGHSSNHTVSWASLIASLASPCAALFASQYTWLICQFWKLLQQNKTSSTKWPNMQFSPPLARMAFVTCFASPSIIIDETPLS